MKIVGVDGGLAHMGIVALSYRPREVDKDVGEEGFEYLGGEVVETKPTPKKHGVRKSDDNMRRAQEVARNLLECVRIHRPHLVVYEAQSFGMKGVIAARQAGTAFGVIAAICTGESLPMLCVTPGDIKKAVCPALTKGATKDDVIQAVEAFGWDIEWPRKKDNWEHLADAIGAVLACRRDDIVRAILRAEVAPPT
jgi:Holliday junction resolvasome RuvABC endonuclease subunit